MSPDDREREIVRSWTDNAESWTEAVRAGHIESRRLATDRAVLEAVLACRGTRVLDVGCGEGWLARSLAQEGRDVVGFDGSTLLMERALELGGGSFMALSYDAFVEDPMRAGAGYDVAVANFSLLGEDIGGLLRGLAEVVTPVGRLVIQTVHPEAVEGPAAQDGWREERFESLASLGFTAMPWYFRSAASWRRELEAAGWRIVESIEPDDPRSGRPASLILVADRSHP